MESATPSVRRHRLPLPTWWSPAWAFLAPALFLIGCFFFAPILAAFFLSLTDFDIYGLADVRNVRWVGWENYVRLLDDELYWKALGNTFYFVLVGGPISVAVSLGAALLLNSRVARFKGLFRAVYFAPVVTTLVAVAVVWRFLLHTKYGLMNSALGWIGIEPVNWLGDPNWAMPAIILMSVWKNFGYNMIIFVAGLQSIPVELYDAATVDGAGRMRTLWHVTLPMLTPTFVFVGLTTMIGYFQLFAEPYVMTQGGPLQSTYSVVLYMYEEGFRWWKLGYAAAVAFSLFVVVLFGALVQLQLSRMFSPRSMG